MSYILDALRRADAERERGAVPGIHAQQVPVHAARAHRGPAPWVWMAGGAGLLLLAMLAWQLMGDEEPAPVMASLPPPLPQTPAAPAPRAPATVSLPPIAVDTERPRPAPARPEAARAPVAASAPEARVPTLQELPEAVRRQIPPMTVGGSIYSKDAASRFLIINGQIFHERDKITPDLVLQEIKLKAAVLSYKGQRFSMTF